MKRIGLKDAIGTLREELSESILAARNEKLRFEVGEIMLEFQVEVEWDVEGGGKVNFWVIEADVGGGRTSSSTHTVRIPLTPVSDDGPVLTGGESDIPRE